MPASWHAFFCVLYTKLSPVIEVREFKGVREVKTISFREKNKKTMLLAITSNDRRER